VEGAIREIQPDIILNNRFDAERKKGDFLTPEQWLPAEQMTVQGKPVLWETCNTLTGRSWGYDKYDKDYRSPETLIKMLQDTAEKGGNMLLNIGPRADGSVSEEAVKRLEKIGQWMSMNGGVPALNSSPRSAAVGQPSKKAEAPETAAERSVDYHVRSGQPVPVTGCIDPGVWSRIKPVRVTQETHWDASAERYQKAALTGWCAFTFRMMHAENILYLAVEVESPQPIARGRIAEGDSAELFFGADGGEEIIRKKDSFQIVIDVDGRVLVPCEEEMPALIFRHGARRTHDGYNIVLAMPFTTLFKNTENPKARIPAGGVFRFNVIVNQATPTKWDTDPDSWGKQDHKPWWEREPRPPKIRIAERHRVHWKGRSMDENPVKNRLIWGRCKITSG